MKFLISFGIKLGDGLIPLCHRHGVLSLALEGGTASLLHRAVVGSQHGPSGQFPHIHAVLQRTSVKVSRQWSYSTKRRETHHDHTSLVAMHGASYLPVPETGGHPACPLSSGQFPAGRERGPLSPNMQTSAYWSAGWARTNRRSCPKTVRHAPYLALLLTLHAKPAWEEPRQPPAKPTSARAAGLVGPWLFPSLSTVQCRQRGFGGAPPCYRFHLYTRYLCSYVQLEIQQLEEHVFTLQQRLHLNIRTIRVAVDPIKALSSPHTHFKPQNVWRTARPFFHSPRLEIQLMKASTTSSTYIQL